MPVITLSVVVVINLASLPLVLWSACICLALPVAACVCPTIMFINGYLFVYLFIIYYYLFLLLLFIYYYLLYYLPIYYLFIYLYIYVGSFTILHCLFID